MTTLTAPDVARSAIAPVTVPRSAPAGTDDWQAMTGGSGNAALVAHVLSSFDTRSIPLPCSPAKIEQVIKMHLEHHREVAIAERVGGITSRDVISITRALPKAEGERR